MRGLSGIERRAAWHAMSKFLALQEKDHKCCQSAGRNINEVSQ